MNNSICNEYTMQKEDFSRAQRSIMRKKAGTVLVPASFRIKDSCSSRPV